MFLRLAQFEMGREMQKAVQSFFVTSKLSFHALQTCEQHPEHEWECVSSNVLSFVTLLKMKRRKSRQGGREAAQKKFQQLIISTTVFTPQKLTCGSSLAFSPSLAATSGKIILQRDASKASGTKMAPVRPSLAGFGTACHLKSHVKNTRYAHTSS
jgi:hypothetical protein